MALIDGGYILLARKMLHSDVMNKPPLWLKLWVWMLEKANHKDNKNGLKRGQFLTTMKELQDEMSWHVGNRHMIPTYDQIRAPLRHWSRRPPEDRPLTISKTTRGMIITICNYSKYQNPKNYENHPEDRPATVKTPHYKQEWKELKKNNKRIAYCNFILKTGEGYMPPEDFIEALSDNYPLVNFKSEFSKISAWCLANDGKRKTVRGAKKFLNSWIERAQQNAAKSNNGSKVLSRKQLEALNE